MRHLLLAAVLAASFAPGVARAASSSALPYTLVSPPASVSASAFPASLGGVTGTITTTSLGTWTMTVRGQTFASGTYTCSGGACTFTGTTLLGASMTFTMASAAGALSGLFPTHGAWVSAVAHWANTHLSGQQIGQVVSEAARIEGPAASMGRAQAAQGLAPGSQGSGHSGDHGGGRGR